MGDICNNCDRPFTSAPDGKVLIYEFHTYTKFPVISLCDRCYQELLAKDSAGEVGK